MSSTVQSKQFIQHVHEVRNRITVIVLVLLVCSGVAYAISDTLFHILQQPINQQLYYTTPGGGFSFLVKLCIAAGFLMTLPVIVYQIVAFLAPVAPPNRKISVAAYTVGSFILAYSGVAFAYYVSLPAALHFLVGFSDQYIQSLIGADAYFNFVIAYIVTFGLLFQIPLFMLFINRITTLRPKKLMSVQRYVIVGSFIMAALFTPTPDPFNQALMAFPIIVLYQVGIILIMVKNRKLKNNEKKANPVALTGPPGPTLQHTHQVTASRAGRKNTKILDPMMAASTIRPHRRSTSARPIARTGPAAPRRRVMMDVMSPARKSSPAGTLKQ